MSRSECIEGVSRWLQVSLATPAHSQVLTADVRLLRGPVCARRNGRQAVEGLGARNLANGLPHRGGRQARKLKSRARPQSR